MKDAPSKNLSRMKGCDTDTGPSPTDGQLVPMLRNTKSAFHLQLKLLSKAI
jgi:hypothetical protein